MDTTAHGDQNLDTLITIADNRMYEDKLHKRNIRLDRRRSDKL